MNSLSTYDILLIEDDEDHAELTRRALERSPVQNALHRVGDGVEALTFLKQTGSFAQAPRPDVILLDLNLPRLGGHEVLAQINSDSQLTDIPIVILTTSDAQGDRQRAFSQTPAGYLIKPLDTEALWGIMTRARLSA